MAEQLASWDFMDTRDQTAPLIFQTIFRHYAHLVYDKELGRELATKMLGQVYYWQENLVDQILNPPAGAVERDERLRLAATESKAELSGCHKIT